MAYYTLCPNCGARLDPGEKCDCREQAKKNAEKWEKMTKEESGGQLCLLPETEKEKNKE